jgi:hypothetical protein
VELLVVIAVAVLLTSLTMPAMRQVHENAQRIMCMSNQQQLGHAFIMYGGDNNDYLPTSFTQIHSETPQNLMMSRSGGPKGSWDGLGVLFSSHYCGSSECFYCPSHHGDHPFERYADSWAETMPTRPIFTNYHYAGHLEWKDLTRRRSLTEGYNLVLATDGLRTAADFNHVLGMNVLRGDGSVRWRDDTDDIYNLLPATDQEQIEPEYMDLWELVAGAR